MRCWQAHAKMYVISYVREDHECETFDTFDCGDRPPIALPPGCVSADQHQPIQYFVSERREEFEDCRHGHAWHAATHSLFEWCYEALSELTVYEFALEDFARTDEDEDEDEDEDDY
jgi:hypothetical protein